MTALQTIQEWIKTFSGCEALQEFSVDYTAPAPGNGGIIHDRLCEADE